MKTDKKFQTVKNYKKATKLSQTILKKPPDQNFEQLEMVRLRRESNPGPPAPQASTLYQRLFEQSYLIAI
jgi:hypothetical protein